MKLTTSQLRKIIKEETSRMMREVPELSRDSQLNGVVSDIIVMCLEAAGVANANNEFNNLADDLHPEVYNMIRAFEDKGAAARGATLDTSGINQKVLDLTGAVIDMCLIARQADPDAEEIDIVDDVTPEIYNAIMEFAKTL